MWLNGTDCHYERTQSAIELRAKYNLTLTQYTEQTQANTIPHNYTLKHRPRRQAALGSLVSVVSLGSLTLLSLISPVTLPLPISALVLVEYGYKTSPLQVSL